MKIILASTSSTRKSLLENAGLEFGTQSPGVDEASALEAAGDLSPADAAELLAQLKAVAVSEHHPGAIVIGADQTLEFAGELITKAADDDALRKKLLKLRGNSHQLHAAIACAKNGEVLWSDLQSASLTMRDFSPEFVGAYMAAEGPALYDSVGGYRLEGRGAQLFEQIDGDFFTILGLPLLPLLKWLREQGVMPS